MSELSTFLRDIDAARKAVRNVDGKQIFSKSVCEQLHVLAQRYFSDIRPDFPNVVDDLAKIDKIFSQIHELSRKNPSRQKCLDTLVDARKAAVRIEGLVISSAASKSAGEITEIDQLILSSLDDFCPPASDPYRQALRDLKDSSRISWRGPATELRESLRETLDKLAPDKEIEMEPNYKAEANAHRPTMKQKVRFILKSRGLKSGQISTSEDSVKFVEESIGGITRSIYTRSSVSTHIPTSREEVVRLHALVRLVLCELLAIPLDQSS